MLDNVKPQLTLDSILYIHYCIIVSPYADKTPSLSLL